MEEFILFITELLAHPLGSNALLIAIIFAIAKTYQRTLIEDKKRLREENDGLRQEITTNRNCLNKDEFQQFTKAHDEVHNGIKSEVKRVEGKIDCVSDKVGEVNEKLIHLSAQITAKKE